MTHKGDTPSALSAPQFDEWQIEHLAAENATLREKLATAERERDSLNETVEMLLRYRKAAEAELARVRPTLVAVVPFLFEYGTHQNKNCYRGSDDGCYCGLDEAKKLVEAALRPGGEKAQNEK